MGGGRYTDGKCTTTDISKYYSYFAFREISFGVHCLFGISSNLLEHQLKHFPQQISDHLELSFLYTYVNVVDQVVKVMNVIKRTGDLN